MFSGRLVVKVFGGGVKIYTQIFNAQGVGAPNCHVAQRSTILPLVLYL